MYTHAGPSAGTEVARSTGVARLAPCGAYRHGMRDASCLYNRSRGTTVLALLVKQTHSSK